MQNTSSSSTGMAYHPPDSAARAGGMFLLLTAAATVLMVFTRVALDTDQETLLESLRAADESRALYGISGAAHLAHPPNGAQGHPRTAKRRASPAGRPFKTGRADGGPGPHSSLSGRLLLSPPVEPRPVESDAPERPLRTGRSFHLLHADPSGGNPPKPRIHYLHDVSHGHGETSPL